MLIISDCFDTTEHSNFVQRVQTRYSEYNFFSTESAAVFVLHVLLHVPLCNIYCDKEDIKCIVTFISVYNGNNDYWILDDLGVLSL